MTKPIIQDANAGASPKETPVTPLDGNISVDDLARFRLGTKERQAAAPETPPEQAEPEEEPAAEESAEGEETPPEPEATEDETPPEVEEEVQSVLSNIQLDNLSEEEVTALAGRLRSQALSRYGELTAKRKQAEEEAAVWKAKVQELSANKNPLQKEKPVENNPFRDLETVEALQGEYENLAQVQEWAENLLDENDTASSDDVIAEQDGRELTKKDVKDYLRKARQARDKFLPARLKELQAAEQQKQLKAHLDSQAAVELPWLGDADSDLRKEYEMALEHPVMKEVQEKVPEAATRFGYLLAHAINSIKGTQQKPKAAPPRSTPPSAPSSTAARGTQGPRERIKKQLSELEGRFKETGRVDDLVALRTTQKRLQNS